MPSPTRFGKYDLLALLATGGMAEIWLARVSGMAGFEKLVVIKRLLDKLAEDPEYVEMFLDEARINARLTHSNIVQVLELGQVNDQYFMAMEYVPGLSVSQVGKRAARQLGAVPQAVACGVVAQACAGLHYAHDKGLPDGTPLGIIHRDISPQNLILTFEGLVKVLDFGIAKASGRKTETRTGMVKGKFSYMSPEQCVGGPLDRRSDIFALGIVLFELATGRRLFKRGSTYQTFTAITNADVPSPSSLNPEVAPEVEAVIMHALQKRPADRFASADAMQEALEGAIRSAGLRASPTDLGHFMESTFADTQVEQRQLVAQAQRGELGEGKAAARVSPVAAAAAAQAATNYVVSDERTVIDPLPPLSDDSGRNSTMDPAPVPTPAESEPDSDAATRALPSPLLAEEVEVTQPTQMPVMPGSPLRWRYLTMAAFGVGVAVLITWLLAR